MSMFFSQVFYCNTHSVYYGVIIGVILNITGPKGYMHACLTLVSHEEP